MMIKPRAGRRVLASRWAPRAIPGLGVGGSSPRLPGHSLPTFQPGPGHARPAVSWLRKPWGRVLLLGPCTWSVSGLIFRPPVIPELAFVPGQLYGFWVLSWGGR